MRLIALLGLVVVEKIELALELAGHLADAGESVTIIDNVRRLQIDVSDTAAFDVIRHDGEITADLPDLLADVQADVVLLAASEVSNPELVLGILDEVEAEVMTMALIDTRTCDCFPQTRILLEDHADVVVSIPYRFDRVLQNLDIPETSP